MHYISKWALMLTVLASLCSYSSTYAANPFGNNCMSKNFRHVNQQVILNNLPSAHQQIFLIHNISQESIMLNHVNPNHDSSMDAGWTTQLDTGNWSAIVLQSTHFALSCQARLPNQIVPVDCKMVITVCQMNPATITKALAGDFWLSEDYSASDLRQHMAARGVKFQ